MRKFPLLAAVASLLLLVLVWPVSAQHVGHRGFGFGGFGRIASPFAPAIGCNAFGFNSFAGSAVCGIGSMQTTFAPQMIMQPEVLQTQAVQMQIAQQPLLVQQSVLPVSSYGISPIGLFGRGFLARGFGARGFGARGLLAPGIGRGFLLRRGLHR
jgi:hypothetical protein